MTQAASDDQPPYARSMACFGALVGQGLIIFNFIGTWYRKYGEMGSAIAIKGLGRLCQGDNSLRILTASVTNCLKSSKLSIWSQAKKKLGHGVQSQTSSQTSIKHKCKRLVVPQSFVNVFVLVARGSPGPTAGFLGVGRRPSFDQKLDPWAASARPNASNQVETVF